MNYPDATKHEFSVKCYTDNVVRMYVGLDLDPPHGHDWQLLKIHEPIGYGGGTHLWVIWYRKKPDRAGYRESAR